MPTDIKLNGEAVNKFLGSMADRLRSQDVLQRMDF